MDENQITELSLNDPFDFACHKEIDCFNECCRDVNQFLTPYDILRLKTHLGLTAKQFLETYTIQNIGPQTGLTVVSLRPDNSNSLRCPFVSPSGCNVYSDRPSSCRIYPIMRIVSRSRETGQVSERFMLLKESHCHGCDQQRSQTVKEWFADQGLATYNEMNDLMMDIIALKNKYEPGCLTGEAEKAFVLACYDTEGFKEEILGLRKSELKAAGIEISEIDDNNDRDVLRAAMVWLRWKLFREHITHGENEKTG